MRIRPGRTRSLLAGIMALVVMGVGLVILTSFGGLGSSSGPGSASGFGGPPTAFLALWVIFGLAGAAAAFYNAFSKRGLPLYEVDVEREDAGEGEYCPRCGKPVAPEDQFCRNCSASLR
jgi:hypothetical protein